MSIPYILDAREDSRGACPLPLREGVRQEALRACHHDLLSPRNVQSQDGRISAPIRVVVLLNWYGFQHGRPPNPRNRSQRAMSTDVVPTRKHLATTLLNTATRKRTLRPC